MTMDPETKASPEEIAMDPETKAISKAAPDTEGRRGGGEKIQGTAVWTQRTGPEGAVRLTEVKEGCSGTMQTPPRPRSLWNPWLLLLAG